MPTETDAGGSAELTGQAVPAILRPGETCWRIVPASRAAFLIDAMEYFSVVKRAFRLAHRSILIVGWDFEPRIRLEPHLADAAEPDMLGELLETLVAERPQLEVRVLRWDMPLVMSVGQHPKLPLRWRQWTTGDRIQYRLDAQAPVGASQHQKLVVIDDALAFCGGIDMAGDRWDRPGHPDGEPLRHTPDGFSYLSHHDVMMAVAGPAAAALGKLARRRWRRATGEDLPVGGAGDALWPEGLEPDLSDVDVGIARTEPSWYSRPPVRENEALFLRSIAAAERSIYLESQYLTAESVTQALAQRLAEPNGPEIVVVMPHESPGWFDRLAMDSARQEAIETLRAADRHGRLGLYSPFSPGGRPIVVHSKLTIVDESFIRVGTANLNNRSMGFDTECDLAVEGAGQQADSVGRAAVRLRERLLAEHLGVSREEVRAAIAGGGGLTAAIETLRGRENCLRPAENNPPLGLNLPLTGATILDPAEPADAWWLVGRRRPDRRPLGGVRLLAVLAGLAGAGWLAARWLRRASRTGSR
ncbi:MAG TPA: phospholipase D-like domain-containing protein [Afifellaceae bacterium]|nr:phospholipase D-like domain-containing protein [Afifellaceae bacterium]